MKTLLLGNAGSGKSTLVARLLAREPAALLALDAVAFADGSAELIFLDPGVEACVAHCRARPWEPDKYASPTARSSKASRGRSACSPTRVSTRGRDRCARRAAHDPAPGEPLLDSAHAVSTRAGWMTPRTLRSLVFAGSVALVVGGVLLDGTRGRATNLFMVYLFAVMGVEVLRRYPAWILPWVATAGLLGSALVGLVDTLGAEHAASWGGGMVCAGLVLAVMSSVDVGPFARASHADAGDADAGDADDAARGPVTGDARAVGDA